MRGQRFFDGCSHVDCPNRHRLTAQPVGEAFNTPARGIVRGIAVATGLRRDPNIQEEQ
jgi:hypothetical protein